MVSLKANIWVSLPWFPNSTSYGHSRHLENLDQCGKSQQGGRGRLIGHVFMKLAGFNDECSWVCIFAGFNFWKSRNCQNASKKIFCLSLYFKIWKFIFRQSESCVLTMSSWSRRVKLCGLKSLWWTTGHMHYLPNFDMELTGTEGTVCGRAASSVGRAVEPVNETPDPRRATSSIEVQQPTQWSTRKFLSTRLNKDFIYFSIYCICI